MTQTHGIKPAKKFTPIVQDYDYSVYVRYISGRMTKARWKAISSYCRRHTYNTNCGHEHDCCGCLCSQTVAFKYAKNAIVINVTQHYNY